MIRFLSKPFRWAIIYSILLIGAFVFILLDTFVTPKALSIVEKNVAQSQTNEDSIDAIITSNSYSDENIQITIETMRKYNTTFYVADIQISDTSYLKTALAKNTYGRNIKETTSEMAETHNAIFAINGDYYGFRDTGYVITNKRNNVYLI